jgi:hypothetical protein
VGDLAAGRLKRIYTVLLLLYGGLSLVIAAGLHLSMAGLDPALRSSLGLSVGIHLLFGAIAIWVGLLRLLRGVPALPASIATSAASAIDFPLGTLLFLYWLLRVRQEERQPPSRYKAVDRYTMIVFIVGFCLLISAVTFLTLLPGIGTGDLFRVLGYVYGGLGLLFVAAGSLRCLDRRLGYYAAFGLNVLLMPLVPVGTALSLYWFLSVRRQEREIVENSDGFAVVADFE